MKLTPAVLASLATTAVIPTVESVLIEVGGAEKNVTAIAGGWYLGSPQPTKNVMIAVASVVVTNLAGRRLDLENTIEEFDARASLMQAASLARKTLCEALPGDRLPRLLSRFGYRMFTNL